MNRPVSASDLARRTGSRPVAPFDPAGYPGPRPAGPALVHEGRVRSLDLAAAGAEPSAVPAAEPSAVPAAEPSAVPAAEPSAIASAEPSTVPDVADLVQVRWVVAYGSNASPGRLVDKGLDRRGAWLLPAVLDGWVPAFEQRRTGYGSVPLTLVPEDGARTDTWVLGVHVDDLPALDRSEGRLPADAVGGPFADDARSAPPGAYRLGHVGEVVVADRWRLPSALAYLPGPRTEVQLAPDGGWRTWPRWGQRAAAVHADAGGPSRRPPAVPAPVSGPWPETPLLPAR